MVTRKKKGSVFAGKVSANAHEQKTKGSSYGYLNLPKGVNMFQTPNSGRVSFDILPYIVTDEKHPDRNDKMQVAQVGELWYKRPYRVHRNVGPNNDSYVCPSSIGKPCPICEYRAKRKMEGADDEELRALNASKRNLYVVVPIGQKEFEEKPHLWDISQFLFQDKLNDELEENPDYEVFPDLEEGLTLKVRFTEASFGKNKFGEVSRIDFDERKEQYTEDFLGEIPELDSVLNILSYKELQAKFLEMEPETEEEEEEEEKPKMSRGRKPVTSIREELEDEEEEEEEPPKKTGKATKKAPPVEEDEEEEEEEIPLKERCVACKGTGKSSKGGKCVPCKGTGRKPKKEEEEEEEEEAPKKSMRRGKGEPEDEEEEPPKKTSKSSKKGSKCPHGHAFGTDTDDYPECEKCDKWDACTDAKEAGEGE